MSLINSKPWASKKINLEDYQNGVSKFVGSNNNGKLICDCSLCEALIALLNNDTDYDIVLKNMAAMVKRDKMSLIVEKPGFYAMKSLSKNVSSELSHIFFPVPGKFSFAQIAKVARENLEKPFQFIDDELVALFGEDIPESYVTLFEKVTPIGKIDGETWDDAKKIITKIFAKEEVAEVIPANEIDFSGVNLIDDRYIPMFKGSDNTRIYAFNLDGTIYDTKIIPGMNVENQNSTFNYLVGLVKKISGFDYSYVSTSIIPFAYDTEKHELIASLDISDFVWNAIRDSGSEKWMIYVNQEMSPGEVVKNLIEDLAKNGASDFAPTQIFPTIAESNYSEMDWVSRRNKTVVVKKPGYLMSVSLNEKPAIGSRGTYGGYIYVRYDKEIDRVKLIASSWCQRVSSWSKTIADEVDQKYDIWPLVDWLSGPFAEDKGINLSSAPLLFCGNKVKTKASAMQQLRDRLDRK